MTSRSLCVCRITAYLSLLASLAFPGMVMGAEANTSHQQSGEKQSPQEPVQLKQSTDIQSKKSKSNRKKVPEALPPPPPPEEPLAVVLDVLDTPRDYLAGHFVEFVNDVDRFFGDDRNFQESRDSVLQLDITRVMGYGGEHKFTFSGRAKVHLPNTEKKLHLLIESNPEKNTTADQTKIQPVLPSASTTPESIGAGVRIEKKDEERWHFSADGGLKFQGINTAPFARARASYAVPLEQWRLKASETAFWFNTTGVGETTQLDLERPISEPLMFRSSSYATWLRNKHNFDLRQDLSFFHTLDERTALLYQLSAIGVSSPHTQATDYVVMLMYRQRLHRKWMYLDVSPQLHFPRARNFQANTQLTVRLEMLFDNPK